MHLQRHFTNGPLFMQIIKRVLDALRLLRRKALDLDRETEVLMGFLSDIVGQSNARILDVGTGYGRLLRQMHLLGFDATGVEVNPDIVAANRRDGLNCLTVEEFRNTPGEFDVILMAHIIEHFSPKELLQFMDGYLDRLKVGGKLVIAAPLASDYFYDDFDHVKPYQPTGIVMVFGAGTAQVQYYSRNALELRALWFRRAPLRITYARSRYLRTAGRFVLIAVDLVCAAAFLLSLRLIGRADGWIGVFEKRERRA